MGVEGIHDQDVRPDGYLHEDEDHEDNHATRMENACSSDENQFGCFYEADEAISNISTRYNVRNDVHPHGSDDEDDIHPEISFALLNCNVIDENIDDDNGDDADNHVDVDGNDFDDDNNYDDDDDDDNDDDDDDDNDDDEIGIRSNDNNLSLDSPFLNINKEPNLDIPLIPKQNITVKDHLLAAIATSVRHKLSYEATLDQLQWIKSKYHANCIPTNKEQLWHVLGRNKDILTNHYYCRNCRHYLGERCKETNKLKTNCYCGASESNLGYFIYLSLTAQIKELMKIPNISESLKYRFWRTKTNPDAYEDIFDGQEYKSQCLPGKFLEKWYNFSFTFNTDRCNVAKSSNLSAWPIYVQINELFPRMRKKHTLIRL
ncbi:uncharacterized protein LOC141534849 [Cotesia typhae]|uniref:uncharacterized protein LOC141534849 n=1 Tax=Cotesia typhae TaxID=2053667 RepID=UPI003D68C643